MQESGSFEVSEASQAASDRLIEGTTNAEQPNTGIRKSRKTWRFTGVYSGWRKGVVISCVCSVIALVLNSILLGWARSKPSSANNGSYILWEGTYETIQKLDTILHLGINVVSIITLAGASSASQIILAPTRENINIAHSFGRYYL